MRHARMRWVSFFTLLFVFGFSPHSRAAPIFSVLKIERPVGVIGYRAFGLNDAGTVVGSLYYSDYHDHAAVWEAGSLTDYGTFGFKHAGFRRITSDGRIIGFIQDGPTPPLTWTDTILFKDGALTRLGTLDGPADEGHRSWPYEINESERIVGNSYIHSETGELLSSRP